MESSSVKRGVARVKIRLPCPGRSLPLLEDACLSSDREQWKSSN